MRISDWSSDVCSSDLHRPRRGSARNVRLPAQRSAIEPRRQPRRDERIGLGGLVGGGNAGGGARGQHPPAVAIERIVGRTPPHPQRRKEIIAVLIDLSSEPKARARRRSTNTRISTQEDR